ncbi:adenylosuccinate synthase [Cohnella thailandensis]|uniref:Adenylosuccinate synthetase n=1 Tax=Cohnella thailandensis TaxID=557557 RepID=A0A841SU48_9BACL|nr:adenylosuccinate synthase [Cohnella thailandensis]MBB6633157.1 adenylosuccinate synthase [Cohnella thailandensis]MBP1975147.1 adenylosuccinate synthase [Cohnella thailandensis]
MAVTAIVGANWGDEGKGKMTDALAARSSYVVRYQGGSNAGHTIINPLGKFALRMLPSGVFYPNVVNVIGPGVALDMEVLLEEWQALLSRGVPSPALKISERAQVVLPAHRLFDELEEERLGARSFGSTKRGIAPFYADKHAKLGIPIAELFDAARLRDRLERLLESKNVLLRHLYGRTPVQAGEWIEKLRRQAESLAPYIGDTTTLLNKAYRSGDEILLEGQLGALRDPDHGIYPFTTSSSTLAGHASVGAGLPPYAISQVIAVTKAYSSCVGAGPFVTELEGAEADELRRRGGDAGEFGVVTGRPRRVGWFDAVATRYGCRIQGATAVALTNLDVLGYLEEIPVCVGYETEEGYAEEFPIPSRLVSARPVYKKLPGWQCDLSQATRLDELPEAARNYIDFLESEIGVSITTVSVGPRREQLIER